MERPAVGAGFDESRLSRATENVGIVCEVLRGEGLWPLHPSHVGGVFETEDETCRLLDELGPQLIGIGSDTGHLRRAGIDPAALIERYADRIGGIHLKDCFPDFLDGAAGDRSYRDLGRSGRLWAEPGLGVVDFDAVLAAIPASYDGDFLIEVDVPASPRRTSRTGSSPGPSRPSAARPDPEPQRGGSRSRGSEITVIRSARVTGSSVLAFEVLRATSVIT